MAGLFAPAAQMQEDIEMVTLLRAMPDIVAFGFIEHHVPLEARKWIYAEAKQWAEDNPERMEQERRCQCR